tara:strand:- start:1179 stop:2375 length:1197 start_codon:yes stop_codon:yes gene_type:complete
MNKDKALLRSIDAESNEKINQLIKIIRKVCNRPELNLHEPFFSGNETQYLEACVSTNFVSSIGPFVNKFEEMLSELTGAKHVIATVNGTSSLHLSLHCLGIKPRDEVLLPALTFVGSANSIRYCAGIPHFCDISENDLNMDLEKLQDHLKFTVEKHHAHSTNKYTKNKIAAIMPVHVYGQPVDMETLLSLASEYKLSIIEDAAESLGSFLNNKHTGTFGEIGCLSFNGNKIVTTGGGGAILTNNDVLAKQIRHLSTTAKITHPWELSHDEIGYNYRMPNINAALGCAQLELFSKLIENKRNLHMKYKKELDNIPWLRLISENKESISNYWLNTIILKNNEELFQKRLIETCHEEKIFLRPAWKPLHLLPMFQSCPKSELNTASFLQKKIINLPSSAFL